jgi:hypothetical protein
VPAHAQRMSSLLASDKEFASCQSRKGGACNGGRGACWEAGERVLGGSVGMHGARLSKGWGPRARAERTKNMAYMFVTLEVSKLSGWLKADAACRVEGRACDAGGGGASRKAGGPVVVAAHKRHAREWPDSRLGGQGHARSARRTCGTWS